MPDPRAFTSPDAFARAFDQWVLSLEAQIGSGQAAPSAEVPAPEPIYSTQPVTAREPLVPGGRVPPAQEAARPAENASAERAAPPASAPTPAAPSRAPSAPTENDPWFVLADTENYDNDGGSEWGGEDDAAQFEAWERGELKWWDQDDLNEARRLHRAGDEAGFNEHKARTRKSMHERGMYGHDKVRREQEEPEDEQLGPGDYPRPNTPKFGDEDDLSDTIRETELPQGKRPQQPPRSGAAGSTTYRPRTGTRPTNLRPTRKLGKGDFEKKNGNLSTPWWEK